MSNDNEATGAGPGITADQARTISTLARTHKDQGAELTEKQFREMTSLQHQIGLTGYTVAELPLSALALDGPNTLAYRLTDPSQSFQSDVADWMGQCVLPSLSSNMTERGDRLLEEVLELLQANGYDSARVPTLVNYVFGRPVGEPAQEVGGVMVTLAAYCSVAGLSMQAAGQAELDRINQPEVMARIREKQEAKNALHFDTPLPGAAAQPSPAGQGDVRTEFESWLDSLRLDRSRHGDGYVWNDVELAWRAVEKFAARQPAGQEPVGTVAYHAPMNFGGFMIQFTSPTRIEPGTKLYAAPPAQAVDLPYSLDADPAGIRARVCDVITGTLMVGAQGHTPPPAGHWAEPFWKAARADAAAQVVDLGSGVKAIAAERERQLKAEGFTREGDQQYQRGELARAATAYVQLAAMDLRDGGRNHIAWHGPAAAWPWAPEWWKPVDARRDLVRAGALIAAQIDLIDSQAVHHG